MAAESQVQSDTIKVSLNYSVEAEYILRRPAKISDSVTLLLHGYGFSGEHIFHKLADYIPTSSTILSPNAPLFTPVKRNGSYRLGYSWYFWDESKQRYLLSDGISVEYIQKLFKELNISKELPLQIIGFSQGGYLAPFVAKEFTQCKQVINIGGRFLHERLEAKVLNFKLFGIHGTKDDTVPIEKSIESHQIFIQNGCTGEFFSYEGLGHDYHPEFREKVRELSF